jgi:type IV secretion system protein TrbG
VLKAADPAPRDHMDGAIKVFAYGPGRVFAVSAAPLRVTTLTLQPGETLVDKAAGDTVRWEIGETTSGSGADVRTLVMLKPLTAGLSTNMVLTTSQRVYLIDLTSNAKHADRAIAWSYPPTHAEAVDAPKAEPHTSPEPATPPVATATRYRIAPLGRRPTWTPQLVFDDGRRTFIVFGPGLDRRPSPLLFVTDGGGAPALVNYRQEGDLYVVDRLIDRGELRLGGDHAEIVRFARLGASS